MNFLIYAASLLSRYILQFPSENAIFLLWSQQGWDANDTGKKESNFRSLKAEKWEVFCCCHAAVVVIIHSRWYDRAICIINNQKKSWLFLTVTLFSHDSRLSIFFFNERVNEFNNSFIIASHRHMNRQNDDMIEIFSIFCGLIADALCTFRARVQLFALFKLMLREGKLKDPKVETFVGYFLWPSCIITNNTLTVVSASFETHQVALRDMRWF